MKLNAPCSGQIFDSFLKLPEKNQKINDKTSCTSPTLLEMDTPDLATCLAVWISTDHILVKSYESWFWLGYNPATEIIINHDEPDLEDLEQVCAVSGQSITITYATWDTMVRIMKNLRLWGRWSLFEYQHIMYKQCYKQESRASASTLCFQSLACHCHQTGARSCARQVRG